MADPSADHPLVFCNALEFLLDRVNMMRIDAANARLRLIAPVVRDHGIDYERGKFQVYSIACYRTPLNLNF